MSSMGVAAGDRPSSNSIANLYSTMGATDVLPYPRRRSSIQLEPLGITSESVAHSSPLSTSPQFKSRTTSIGTEDDLLPGAVVDMAQPPILNPVKNFTQRRFTNPATEEQRCHSCEHPQYRGRSQSLCPERIPRPGEGRRRRHGSEDANDEEDDESTAQFIEKLRRELLAQM